jgi:hypothetical protein
MSGAPDRVKSRPASMDMQFGHSPWLSRSGGDIREKSRDSGTGRLIGLVEFRSKASAVRGALGKQGAHTLPIDWVQAYGSKATKHRPIAFYNRKFREINFGSKARMHLYLSTCIPMAHVFSMASLRLGSHGLRVDSGRWEGGPATHKL